MGKDPMTFDKFVIEAFHYGTRHQRTGQALFNCLSEHRRDLAQRIAGTQVDPFMIDARITACLDWLEHHWHLNGDDSAIWEAP